MFTLPHDEPLPLHPPPPAPPLQACQAAAWRALLSYAADAPPRIRNAVSTLMEFAANAPLMEDRTRATLRAGAAHLDALILTQGGTTP
jgi:hypothetical protein